MAPKKTILVLIIILITSLTAAQSLKSTSSDVWVDQTQNVEFNYTGECAENINATYEFDGVSNQIDEVVNTTFEYSDFSQPGTYRFSASCNNASASTVVEAGELSIESLDLFYENEDTAYADESIEGAFQFSTGNEDFQNDLTKNNFTFSSDGREVDFSSFNLERGSFAFDASSLQDSDRVSLSALESSIDTEVSVEPVWKFKNIDINAGGEDITDNTIKYRHLSTLKMSFQITKKGESISGLSTDKFLFDREDGWFIKTDQGNGNYIIEIEGRPQYSEEDLNVDDNYILPIQIDTSSGEEKIVDLTVEKDVEFSGNVLDVSNNRVNTDFESIVERKDSSNKIVPFNTDDSGYFEQYYETDTVDMKMKFPEAMVSLSQMHVDKENAGDISYHYYDNPKDQSNIDPNIDVRPVNLAAFVSNYPFQADSLDTFAQMQYDTSTVDPLSIEVYECSQWTFDAEECSSKWQRISKNDVNLASGSTWEAEFPISPLTSDRFATDEGVLQNAYLVGVPKGLGSSLTLQNSLDVSNTRVQSGEELTVSGVVIDSSTGESVNNADVSLELVSDSKTISLEGKTQQDGSFELSKSIDNAGSYSVNLEVKKNPYDSFTQKSDNSIEVYYETGIDVVSDRNIDLQLGKSSAVEFEVENVGQSSIQEIEAEVDVAGIDSEFYNWDSPNWDLIESGESEKTVLTLDIPSEDLSPGEKRISLDVSGVSAGEEVENSATVYANVPNIDENNSNQDEESSETQNSNSESSLNVPDAQQVSNVTGEFVQSQSDMNLALGLILVFGAILAVTVRKRKNSDGRNGRRLNGRSPAGGSAATGGSAGASRNKVQRPKVSPEVEETSEEGKANNGVEEKDEEISESPENEQEEDSKDGKSSTEIICDTCGEEFDTQSGLKLHKNALH